MCELLALPGGEVEKLPNFEYAKVVAAWLTAASRPLTPARVASAGSGPTAPPRGGPGKGGARRGDVVCEFVSHGKNGG